MSGKVSSIETKCLTHPSIRRLRSPDSTENLVSSAGTERGTPATTSWQYLRSKRPLSVSTGAVLCVPYLATTTTGRSPAKSGRHVPSIGFAPLSVFAPPEGLPCEAPPETAILAYEADPRILGSAKSSGQWPEQLALDRRTEDRLADALGLDMDPQDWCMTDHAGMTEAERMLYLAKAGWPAVYEDEVGYTDEECLEAREDFAQLDYAFRQRALTKSLLSRSLPGFSVMDPTIAPSAAIVLGGVYNLSRDYKPPRSRDPDEIISEKMREHFPPPPTRCTTDLDSTDSVAFDAIRGNDPMHWTPSETSGPLTEGGDSGYHSASPVSPTYCDLKPGQTTEKSLLDNLNSGFDDGAVAADTAFNHVGLGFEGGQSIPSQLQDSDLH